MIGKKFSCGIILLIGDLKARETVVFTVRKFLTIPWIITLCDIVLLKLKTHGGIGYAHAQGSKLERDIIRIIERDDRLINEVRYSVIGIASRHGFFIVKLDTFANVVMV